MKKTLGKALLMLGCIAVIAFLLLPFLETSAPQPPAAAAQKPTPQIFTSNPLTELVNRIARFFGKRQKREAEPKTLTAQQAEEKFGTPQTDGQTYADARAAAENYISTEETPSAGNTRKNSFENASIQDEEGEWVLIRQKTPENSAPGMHEINSKDNAYDQYIRQERAARFTPAARQQTRKSVPDSKLARFFNPIKRFFGFESAEKQLPNQDIWQEQDGALLASSQGIGKSRNETGSSFARGGNVDLAGIGGELPSDTGTDSETMLLSYLEPDALLDEVSDFLADSKYPDPKTEQEKQEKANYRQQRRAENLKYFKARAQERMNRLAAGQEPEDELNNLLAGACSNKKPRSVKNSDCNAPVPAPASQSQLNNAKQKNAALFTQKTTKKMPPVAIMPVIGRAGEIPPAIPPEYSVEAYTKTMELYEFMFQNADCAKDGCYWVANSIQTSTDLSDSIEAAGAKLRGDPLDKYAAIQDQFVQAKLDEGAEGANAEELQKQTEDFAPAYILYSTADLKELQAKNREALRQRNQQAGTAMFVLSAPIAQQISRDLNSTSFFYGRNDSLIDADNYPTFEERGTLLTNDLADQIQFFQQIGQEIKRNASREVVQDKTRAQAELIRQQAAQERAAFDKANSLGNTERGK